VKRFLGVCLVILMVSFLTIPIMAAEQNSKFHLAVGASAFQAELNGTTGNFISPVVDIEVLNPYKNLEYGVKLKGYFFNEITLGFVPIIKLNFSKRIYFKMGLGMDLPLQAESGRAVYKAENTKEKYEENLWVKPAMNNKLINTGFFCVGLGAPLFAVELGVEYREFTKEWQINKLVETYQNSSIFGAMIRIVY